MKPINILSIANQLEPSVIGLGFFDGIHLGHLELISKLVDFAKNSGHKSSIFTFDESPKRVLAPQNFRGYITTPEEKFELLSKTGVDNIYYVPFTKEFASINCQNFVKDILINKINACNVFVGFNFKFGVNRSGNTEKLVSELAQYDAKCNIIEPVKTPEGETVSSSLIRTSIIEGNITKANQLLGRSFSFSGKVVHGDHRGTEMSFPTANLLLQDSIQVLPSNGVYACFAETLNGTFPALVNIGYRPTFNKDLYLLEAHLCNYSGNLYNQTIKIKFLKKIRPEIKFPSMKDLISQIEKDQKALMDILQVC